MNRIVSCFKGKCPNCEKGEVHEKKGSFSFKLPKMKERCDECGHQFMKEPGFFYGAMYVSYGLAMGQIIAVFVICQFFFDKMFDLRMLGIMTGILLLLSYFNYKMSRMIWMYLFTPKGSSSKS